MPRLRRATAIVASLLMLQFIALGNGSACAMANQAHQGMADMVAPAAPKVTGPSQLSHESHTPRRPACPGSSGAPCGVPGMPPACVAMAVCAPVAAMQPAVARSVAPRLHAQSVRVALLKPPFRAIAPELPPPRA